MTIQALNYDFSVCKVPDISQIDFDDEFCFLGKTDEEISLVCLSDKAPKNAVALDGGWKAFRIKGTLDFSLVGVLSKITQILAENGIAVFAISTYDTDYVLTKKENFESALLTLSENGFCVE